jgi:hypothetical protein
VDLRVGMANFALHASSAEFLLERKAPVGRVLGGRRCHNRMQPKFLRTVAVTNGHENARETSPEAYTSGEDWPDAKMEQRRTHHAVLPDLQKTAVWASPDVEPTEVELEEQRERFVGKIAVLALGVSLRPRTCATVERICSISCEQPLSLTRAVCPCTKAVLIGERLEGKGIVARLDLSSATSVAEAVPLTLLVLGLVIYGTAPILQGKLFSNTKKSMSFGDQLQVTFGRLACLGLAGAVIAELMTGKVRLLARRAVKDCAPSTGMEKGWMTSTQVVCSTHCMRCTLP